MQTRVFFNMDCNYTLVSSNAENVSCEGQFSLALNSCGKNLMFIIDFWKIWVLLLMYFSYSCSKAYGDLYKLPGTPVKTIRYNSNTIWWAKAVETSKQPGKLRYGLGEVTMSTHMFLSIYILIYGITSVTQSPKVNLQWPISSQLV